MAFGPRNVGRPTKCSELNRSPEPSDEIGTRPRFPHAGTTKTRHTRMEQHATVCWSWIVWTYGPRELVTVILGEATASRIGSVFVTSDAATARDVHPLAALLVWGAQGVATDMH